MSFEINIKDKSLIFISSLQKRDRERLKEAILVLKNDPVPIKSLDIAKIKGEKNTYRIRKGKLRIVYEVIWEQKLILIHRVDFRGDAYK
ncbi:MAG: type II toxin-antitoxin system RelE/ParE family toxin [Euryarchaeota archaeon]|nr:type II toxin-antitoxin system RelE/ParE family toxin [Euryarchaeota archaeon]MBU4492581.1 type II toxin-antitoxin system RelE/ParE family toxin [Euryarchaeota archaeon]MCG2727198.1 type II toxin-antitoxin system RelE/ParE family toxin [Candidatus Methanoperedenaceae archaeon]